MSEWLTLGAVGTLAALGLARRGSKAPVDLASIMARATGRHDVINLFAGSGAVDLGLSRAGWRTVLMVEHNETATQTLRNAVAEGYIEGEVVQGDVATFDYRSYRGAMLMWSSFPCQPYSTAGLRAGALDPRDGWPMTIRAIDQVKPIFFVGENVGGLTQHRCRGRRRRDCPACTLQQVMLGQLRERFAWADSFVLNAADFGVPQSRKRVFLMAGPVAVQPPAPTYGPGTGRRCPRTLGEVLDYDPWERLEPMFYGYRESELPTHLSAEYQAHGRDDWWCEVCEAALSAEGAYEQAFCWCPPPGQAETELDIPAPTLTGGSQRSHVSARSIVSASAPKREKILAALSRETGGYSVAEAAAIQGFPGDWPFAGSNQRQYRQIANAVPPALAAAVGRAVGRVAWSARER